ncbi:MAG: hypothetical protein JNN00_07405 [Chitinophagaceae bacterium]|nr:hypothetical protein [Chitinophagaceae bacterium]
MRKATIHFFLLSILISCNNGENADGGPCTYDDKILPARLISFDTINTINFDALFLIGDRNCMEWKDTMRYSALSNHHYLSAEDIAKDSLANGKTYQYISKTIRSGSCNPHVEMLVLKPYGK